MAKLIGQAKVDAKRTPEASGDADVLPDEEHLLVVPHLLGDRFPQCLGDGEPPSALGGRGPRGHRAASLLITVA